MKSIISAILAVAFAMCSISVYADVQEGKSKPVLDGQGKAVLDGQGRPVESDGRGTESQPFHSDSFTISSVVNDGQGKPVVDGQGKPVESGNGNGTTA